MSGDWPTVGELWRSGRLRRADLDEAVAAYFADPKISWLPVGEHHVVDPDAALAARPFSRRMMTLGHARPSARATALINALVLAKARPG